MTLTEKIEAQPMPVRPEHHFTPLKGWMNDPNGLVYFEGEYHLFYQYYPADVVWGPMHWGHAVSTDLMHWQHLANALEPDEQGMCFSGSAIVDHNDTSGLFNGQSGLLCFYTSHLLTGSGKDDYVQEQCIAYSQDKGRTWQKYTGNPVIAAPSFRDFRDPKVCWHASSQAWIMSVACGQSIQFYRSTNLIDWQFASEFGLDHGVHSDGPWECPDLVQLSTENGAQSRWVLIVGVGASEEQQGSLTQYFIGDFDGFRFTNENSAETILMMDHGSDFYAAQSWSDEPTQRAITLAWASNWLYADQIPHQGWRGMMSLPRVLALTETKLGLRLRQTFAAEINSTYCRELETQENIMLVTGSVCLLAAEQARAADYTCLDLTLDEGSSVRLLLNETESSVICIEKSSQGLLVVHTREGLEVNEVFDKHYPCVTTLPLIEGDLELKVCRDRGIQELLINDGEYSITSQDCSTAGFDNLGPIRIEVLKGQAKINTKVFAIK